MSKSPYQPSVAICIPTYNQADYLRISVESALSQTYPNTEIWISDDCSTDNTPEVIAALQREHPQIKSFRQADNLGMSGNPRWIVKQPKTDMVAKLDSDDFYEPGYISELVGLLQANPKAGYAHCAVTEVDDDGSTRRIRRLGRASPFVDTDQALRDSTGGFRVCANIILFRREVLESVDFYMPDLQFCDDWDIGVRIADAGWGNVYTGKVLASYRVWNDEGNVRPRRRISQVKCSTRVFVESVIPAYEKRKWSLDPVYAARRKLAKRHAMLPAGDVFTLSEQEELRDSILALSDKPSVRVTLALNRIGLGGLHRFMWELKTAGKGFAKRLLHGT